MSTPIIHKIRELLQQKHTGFHTPGHNQGKGCKEGLIQLFSDNFLRADLTEISGLDNLKDPKGCIAEAQRASATTFGAKQTFFLVNGSTVGIHASLLAVNRTGYKVLIPRHSHISVINGLILNGGKPVIAPCCVDSTWGVPLGVRPEDITKIINHNPDLEAAVITQPTYQGWGWNFNEIKREFTDKNITLVVDEAHGSHLYFQNRLPLSAQQANADIVVHSSHKTLTAFTQASMLHINKETMIEPIKQALDILQTSSPSYLLMASLDGVQGQMRESGYEIVQRVWELGELLRAYIKKIPGYRVMDEEIDEPWYYDPSKVMISAADIGLTGWELATYLLENHGIYVEQSEYFYILILLTPGHTKEDIVRLLTALRSIWENRQGGKLQDYEIPSSFYEEIPTLILTPRQVFLEEKENVDHMHSQGRISGTTLTIYPPGVPIIWPGQIILQDHLDYLNWALNQGLPVQGMKDGKIPLVKEGYKKSIKVKGERYAY